jgi:phage head maturation protease
MPDLITRRAPLQRGTFNREARTVDAILSAGSDVQRRDARGPYLERLNLSSVTVRDGADRVPLLDNHNRTSIHAILGSASNIRTENGSVLATLHIADDRALNLIEAGALSGVSIGYLPASEEWSTTDGQRVRSLAPVIHETSLTEFPADPAAAILRSTTMDVAQQIRSLVAAARLPVSFADGLITRNASLEEAQTATFAELTTRGVQLPAYQTGPSGDDPSVIVTRMSAALACRMMGTAVPEEARQYAGMGWHDLCRSVLAARGERVLSMSAEALLTRAIGTGDLPNIAVSTGNRILQANFEAAASPLKTLARQSTAADFRNKTSLRVGGQGLLERVAENAEVHYGALAEAAETYRLFTYAKIWALSRELLINDDVSAFSDMFQLLGRNAAETEARLLVDLLVSNPVMSDTFALFNGVHGNVGVAAAIDENSLAAGVQAMRVQTGISGEPINAVPRYLLVSPAKELQARQAVAAYYPPTSDETNPIGSTLTVLVEARLTGNRWYLFSDPASLPVLEYSYLSSAPGPQTASRAGFDVLGMEFRVLLDYGAGVLDWRGAYSNPGA